MHEHDLVQDPQIRAMIRRKTARESAIAIVGRLSLGELAAQQEEDRLTGVILRSQPNHELAGIIELSSGS